ncbi:RNA polymerase sigma factor region1.1 domain-containing protein [Methylobacterium sp. J-067]|uniref:RNA polymerase sigma factor region1.1 domain-containing protein n=1 Tax=Methylobacterium sp. J-067 TaxID=2836648 RepID=UPI001FBB0692|nr:RNA polymerase sigma factor region1.1 domain-containing protein [Methylobacterium sp. J-067]MCJ2023426.1 RNA polymerase sigma factor region1.1 domain-containing protein [Methylobacterium sp. J-067]
MAAPIDRATLDRLIALGRQRGELTASELQAALPVEALDVDALVLVMLELEAAGVSVEPDAFGPRGETVAAPRFTLAAPDPDPPPALASAGRGDGPAAGAEPPPAPGPGRADPGDEDVGRVVLFAGLAVVLVIGAILLWL